MSFRIALVTGWENMCPMKLNSAERNAGKPTSARLRSDRGSAILPSPVAGRTNIDGSQLACHDHHRFACSIRSANLAIDASSPGPSCPRSPISVTPCHGFRRPYRRSS